MNIAVADMDDNKLRNGDMGVERKRRVERIEKRYLRWLLEWMRGRRVI